MIVCTLISIPRVPNISVIDDIIFRVCDDDDGGRVESLACYVYMNVRVFRTCFVIHQFLLHLVDCTAVCACGSSIRELPWY